jgi:hypothetical protein
MPQIEIANFAQATGNNDYDHPIIYLPDLTKGAPSGAAGLMPANDLYLRSVTIIPEANITGAATNNMLVGIKQYRAGAAVNQISTQNTGSISTGSQTVTPVTGTLMANIAVGTVLHVAAGGGTAEDVKVTAVTSTTFTATFGFTHTANTAITGIYLAAVWYDGAGVTETSKTPHQLVAIPNQILPGDYLSLARVSFGTGLTTPALSIALEWVALSNKEPLG